MNGQKYRKSRKRCFAKKSTENLENMWEKQYNLFVSQCIYFFCLIISFPCLCLCLLREYKYKGLEKGLYFREVWVIFGLGVTCFYFSLLRNGEAWAV